MKRNHNISRRLSLVLSLAALMGISGCGYTFESVSSSGESNSDEGEQSSEDGQTGADDNQKTELTLKVTPDSLVLCNSENGKTENREFCKNNLSINLELNECPSEDIEDISVDVKVYDGKCNEIGSDTEESKIVKIDDGNSISFVKNDNNTCNATATLTLVNNVEFDDNEYCVVISDFENDNYKIKGSDVLGKVENI